MAEVEQKKCIFHQFTYCGMDLGQLLDIFPEQLIQLYSAQQWWILNWGLQRKQPSLLKHLSKAKKEAPLMEKPEVVKTHLWDMIMLPKMAASMVGVYYSKIFNQVEIKPEMIGHYQGEFSNTCNPVKYGRPGIRPLTPQGSSLSSPIWPIKTQTFLKKEEEEEREEEGKEKRKGCEGECLMGNLTPNLDFC